MTTRNVSERPTLLATSIQSAITLGLMLVVMVCPMPLRNLAGFSRSPPFTIRSRSPAMTSCWRAARVKSLSPAALRIRAYPSACSPSK